MLVSILKICKVQNNLSLTYVCTLFLYCGKMRDDLYSAEMITNSYIFNLLEFMATERVVRHFHFQ